MCRSLYCYMNMEETMFAWLPCLFLDPINSLPWTYIWKMNIDMSVFVSLKTDIAFLLCHYCPFTFLWTPCYVLGGHLQCNGTRPNVCLWAFAHCHTLVHVQYTGGNRCHWSSKMHACWLACLVMVPIYLNVCEEQMTQPPPSSKCLFPSKNSIELHIPRPPSM